MMKNKVELSIAGKTTDGKIVVKGLFEMISTYGIPLIDALIELQKNNMVVDWIDYYKTSSDNGMSEKRILERLKYSLIDVYGEEYSNNVITTLKFYIQRKELE